METIAQIALTPAELEMIEISRKQKQLDDEKKAAAKKIEDERKITNYNKEVSTFQDNKAAIWREVKKYFEVFEAKFPGLYNFVSEEKTNYMEAYNYNYPEGSTSSVKEVLISDDVKYSEARIERTGTKIYVVVKETFKSSRYNTKSVGYKMFVEGIGYDQSRKGLIKAETAHTNIQEYINLNIRKQTAEQMEKEGWAILEAEVKKEFPEAEVTAADEYEYSRGSSRGYNVKLVKAKFVNGLVLKYSFRYYTNQDNVKTFSKSLLGMDRSNLDQDAMIKALINVPAKTK